MTRGLTAATAGLMIVAAFAMRPRALDAAAAEPTGGIQGRVVDAATGRPVARAVVAAQLVERRHRRRVDGWGQDIADDQGRFTIDGLEPGVYNVVVLVVPGRKQATASAAIGVRVKAGAEATADLSVIEGRPLRGFVIDRGDDDKPVGGAQVGCHGPAQPMTGQAVMYTTTDRQGRFAFHVPPGEHFVYLIDDLARNPMGRRLVVVPERGENLPVFLLLPKDEELEPAAATAEVVVADAPLRAAGGDVRKPAEAPRTVNGRVTDPEGRPLPGIRVTADTGPKRSGADPFLGAEDLAVTDRDGRFILDGLPRRQVWLTLGRPFDQVQKESVPADRDEVSVSYRPQREQPGRLRAALVEDEPIPPDLPDRLTFVDLTESGNNFLADGPDHPSGGNNLDRVPRGVHKMADAYFRIGDKMVHVRGMSKEGMPVSVGGIKVAARGKRIHLLHGNQHKIDAGKGLGEYVIHYADGSKERIPIIYERNVIDWWDTGLKKDDLPEAKVAWRGSNEMLDKPPNRDTSKIGLWAVTWTNPHPDKEIATIEVVSSVSACDPYLVAVTVEREK
jgi:hypothetical protein